MPPRGRLDRGHAAVSGFVERFGLGVDRWLGGRRTNQVLVADDTPPHSRLIVSQEAKASEHGVVDYRMRLKGHLALPQFQDRLQIIVATFVEDDEVLPVAVRCQGGTKPLESKEDGEAGVRYLLVDRMRTHLSVGTGVRFHPSPNPRVRIRGSWRAAQPVDAAAERDAFLGNG